MQNKDLIGDYLFRCDARLKAIETLRSLKSWSDVVRESQEVVELALKAYLRFHNVMPPRVHDVSPTLEENIALFGKAQTAMVENFIEVSRIMRRDRELAFYGSEDLTPSQFYKEKDAKIAFGMAKDVVQSVVKIVNATLKE